jgi:hypothetical protein
MSYNELKLVIQQLNNIIYNTSQNDSAYNSKDIILDSLISIIKEYNSKVDEKSKFDIKDFRKLA